MPGAGLGETFDLSVGFSPVDMSTAANTGKRVALQFVDYLTIVLIKAIGTAAQDPVLTLKQHTASTGGVTSNLAVVDRFWTKTGASTLLGSETWTQVTQTASQTVTLTGGAALEMIVAINLDTEQVTAGNTHVSLDIADVGASAQLGTVLYLLRTDGRGVPTSLPAPLR